MAKKRVSKNYSVSQNGDLLVQKISNQPNTLTSDSVAYKVDANIFRKWLLPYMAHGHFDILFEEVFPNSINEVVETTKLLGIQFEFTPDSNNVEVYQVYYIGAKSLFFKRSFGQMGVTILGTLTNDDIHKVSPRTGNDGYELGDKINIQGRNYNRLDCFHESIGLVYFTIDQLYHMAKYYDQKSGYMIISGSELRLAKKIGQRANEFTNYNDQYFTLKIEGQEGGISVLGDVNSDLFIPAADIAIGHPCPPKWYLFRIMQRQAAMLFPEMDQNQAVRSWTELVVKNNFDNLIKECKC